jgi:general nucleoside transport system permease protein
MGPFDTAWLASVILLSTPLVLAATGELMSERGGILNIGLEGMMLSGAFFSFLGTYLWHNVLLGVVTGMAAGIVVALVMALLCIRFRSDQIVVGVGLNLLALGVTTFTFREIFSAQNEVHLAYPAPVSIPLLSRIPVIGPTIFHQTLLGYFAFVSVGLAWFTLYRTSFGLAIRAAGEVPAAADTAGVSVNGIRTVGACIAGAMAGAAGAYLSVGRLGLFNEGMTGGRGFLALAVVIFGGWTPIGVMGAALVFGAADALQLRLQSYESIPRQVWLAIALVGVAYLVSIHIRDRSRAAPITGTVVGLAAVGVGLALFVIRPDWQFPPQLWLTLPYVFALLALAGLVSRARMPSALATVYRRGEAG